MRHLLTHTSGIKDWEGNGPRLPEGLHGGRARQGGDEATPGLRARHAVELQQHGLRASRHPGAQDQRQVLRRLPEGAGLLSAGHGVDADHQRVGHREEPGRRLHPEGRQAREPGVGLPFPQHHRRRLALHHGPRHGEVGRRPSCPAVPQAGELRGDVVAREARGAARPIPTASPGGSTTSVASGSSSTAVPGRASARRSCVTPIASSR